MKDIVKVIITNVLCAVISSYIIIHFIGKNSVHPEHGNYVKIDYLGNPCNPWDSCPQFAPTALLNYQTALLNYQMACLQIFYENASQRNEKQIYTTN